MLLVIEHWRFCVCLPRLNLLCYGRGGVHKRSAVLLNVTLHHLRLYKFHTAFENL